MATNAQWTVVFEDKLVIKQSGDAAGTGYNIVDNDFWGLAKWDNVWAIQYGTSNPSDTVEYRDGTPHSGDQFQANSPGPRRVNTAGTGNAGSGQGHSHNMSATFTGDSTSVVQPYIAVIYIIKT